MDQLSRQIKDAEYKKDAEDCIVLYNWIKETDPDGRVWESRWRPLVTTNWIGTYPNAYPIHKPTITGYAVLKGIRLK